MPAYKDIKTNTWYVQFYYTDWTGKRKHKVKRGFPRKKEAEAYEHSFKSIEQPNQITIGALADEFIKSLESKLKLGSIKPSTFDAKSYQIKKYILPYFKDTEASSVKVKDVEEWIQVISVWPARKSKYKDHPTTKTMRSSNTVNTARQLLGQVYKFGMKNFGLKNDPTSLAERMKYHTNDERVECWTLDQFNTFLNYVTLEHYRVFFTLLFYSGLRLGEALAITPDDIEDNVIHVNKTWVELRSGDKLIGKPKTLSSARDVIIPQYLVDTLNEYMDMLLEIKKTDRLFPMGEQRVRAYMSSVNVRANLPRLSPHGLRHSYASYLFSICKNINIVSKQLGHANANITQRVYSHMLPDEDVEAIKNLNDSISKNVENLDINSN